MEADHAHRCLGVLGRRLALIGFLLAVRTMSAAALAAESALQQGFGGEDHVGAVPIEISSFLELGWGGHCSGANLYRRAVWDETPDLFNLRVRDRDTAERPIVCAMRGA